MSDVPSFELWLEFEEYAEPIEGDPTDDFANVHVRLPDGRKYAMNVWTFKFLDRSRLPWPYLERACDLPSM